MSKKRSSSSTATTPGNFFVLPFPTPPLRRCSAIPTDILLPPPPQQPPRSPQHGLLRAISDPNPILSHSPAASDTASESPASKRLKRMSQRMREMKQWFDELIQDSSSSDKDETEENEEINEKSEKEVEEKEKETEEVKKEDDGDAINLQFKCPCGNAHHILLFGHDCYYKLL